MNSTVLETSPSLVCLRFGGYLLSTERANSGDVLTVFLAVLIGGFSLGQAFPNLENLITAAGAAGTIYDIIDRVRPC